MDHIRHSATILAGILVSMLCLLAAPSAAFAMALRPPEDSGP